MSDQDTPKQTTGRQPDTLAYTVKDRGQDKDPVWNRIGAAWAHKDGKGQDVILDAIPVDGRITLRENRAEDFKEKRRQSSQTRQDRGPGYDR